MNARFFKYFSCFGLSLLKKRNLDQLIKIDEDFINFFTKLAITNGVNRYNIKSQILQDIFVLYVLNWKKNGFFVEFGATNGVELSNTFLLEKDFKWRGILCEPAPIWRHELKKNRNKAILDFNCVWKKSGEFINFGITDDPKFSTISKFVDNKNLATNKIKKIKTISLNDLLKKHKAPKNIDYLSIDTEGSELEILKSFNFSKYKISIITCEHNYSKDREKIHEILKREGFTRIYEGCSRWDDWFVNNEIK